MWKRVPIRVGTELIGYRYSERRLVVSTRHSASRIGVFKDGDKMVHCPLFHQQQGWNLVECPANLVMYQNSPQAKGSLTPVPRPEGWEDENRVTDHLHRTRLAKNNPKQSIAGSLEALTLLCKQAGLGAFSATPIEVSADLSSNPAVADG